MKRIRPLPQQAVPIDRVLPTMNRQQRRAAMRQTGRTWGGARELAKRMAREREMEAEVAAKASRLSPEGARRALAEWASKGGGPATIEPSHDDPKNRVH